MDFTAFALSQLPPPPARVLELGCGARGGITLALADAGYDALGIDPHAPVGERFRAIELSELPQQPFDAVVAERVLHHVHPLRESLDKLAQLAPLLVLDEFAWDRMDAPTRDWYELQHRTLRAAGVEPKGPPDLGAWRREHQDLHTSGTLRRELAARYDERSFEWRPYLYRWLAGPASEGLEQALLDAGEIQPIGLRWVGTVR